MRSLGGQFSGTESSRNLSLHLFPECPLRRGVGQEGMAASLVFLMGRKVFEKFPEIGGRDMYFGF